MKKKLQTRQGDGVQPKDQRGELEKGKREHLGKGDKGCPSPGTKSS